MDHTCYWHAASPAHDSLRNVLSQFQRDFAPSIYNLVAGQIGLRPWIPDPTISDSENLRYLKRLNIPAVSPFLRHKPSLLLHELGWLGSDPDYKSYITQILRPSEHTLLVNTSGSGKTRILLEGLCQHWGLYFSTQDPTKGISSLGSQELSYAIYRRLPQSPDFTENLSHLARLAGESPDAEVLFQDKLKANTDLAQYLFHEVLLARLIVFELFLAAMKAQGLCSSNKVKRQWLLLQIDPSLLGTDDIFLSLVKTIHSQHIGSSQMVELISAFWCSIRAALGETSSGDAGDPSHIFLVIDEAQDAVEKFPDAFRSQSSAGNSQTAQGLSRPVLRELVRCWFNTVVDLSQDIGTISCTFVITGTGISREMMQEALTSSIFKDHSMSTVHVTGGLETPEAQLKYIRRYLPESFLESQLGQAIVHRLWYWLSGRFRFTAGYIALLIEDGLRRPHTMLNEYIKASARIKATDNKTFAQEEPVFAEYPRISTPEIYFDKLLDLEHRTMLTAIKNLVYNYFRRSFLPESAHALGDDESYFVQFGFARYRKRDPLNGDQAEVCEPIILLASAVWLNTTYEPLHKSLCDELGTDSTSKNGFEDYLVYYFTRVFGDPDGTPLERVFNFVDDNNLRLMKATLVAVHRSEINEAVVDFSATTFGGKMAFLSGCLGENAKSPARLEEWVQLKKHTAFSFPPLAMGPDILFVLKLHTPYGPRYIWVAVQAKFIPGGDNSARFIGKSDLEHAIRTVTPSRFYLSKNSSDPIASVESASTSRRDAILEVFDGLPHREHKLAGRHSVLRVVAVFPPEAKVSDVSASDLADGHPLALLRHDYLLSCLSAEHPTNKLRNVKRDHLKTIADREAKKKREDHPRHRQKLDRLRELTLPDTWDHAAIAQLDANRKIDDYFELYRLLLNENIPEKGKGARRLKEQRIDLLCELFDRTLVVGGPNTVADLLANRASSPSAGPSNSPRGWGSTSLEPDGDVRMYG